MLAHSRQPTAIAGDTLPGRSPDGGGAITSNASRDYAERYLPEDDVLVAARERTKEVQAPPIAPAAGAVLRFLAAALNARTAVEIGTGGGVSGIWLLRGMARDGVLTSIDAEREQHRLARRAFTEAGFAHNRVRLITGRALEVLPRLTDHAYDLVVCDAAKEEYPAYLDAARRLLRDGGIVVFDNALWHDRVADPVVTDPETTAIREVARSLREDESFVPVLLPVGDGLLAAVRRR